MTSRWKYVVASAVLFAVAFPPFNLILPAFLCLVPITLYIAHLANNDAPAWEAAKTGFWFGLLGYACNLYWIASALYIFTPLAALGYVGAIIWLAPIIAITFTALFVARRLTGWPFAILLPIIWTASELLLNYLGDLSFPWLPLGLSMSHYPLMLQAADISGVRGLSFWIAATSGLIVDAWMFKDDIKWVTRRAVIVAAMAIAVAGYGYWRMHSIPLTPVTNISVIQPNIPEEAKIKGDRRIEHVGITAAATRAITTKTGLVVWPETALSGFLWRYPEWRDSLRAVASTVHAPILFGVLDSNWPSNDKFRYWNAAMITDSTGEITGQEPYHKEYLVPIVERVPFVNPDWFEGIQYFGGFGRGENPVPFTLPFGKVGVLICYESVFPQLSRNYKKDGVTLLSNITNDAWFGHSSAPYQHFAHLAIRAVETRLPIVRSANTGISGYIDPLGRVRESTAIFSLAVGTYVIESTTAKTLYLYLGDWIGGLCALGVLALLAVAFKKRRSQRSLPL